jgi:chromatin structure-remodeling complex subunit SFH1
MAAVNVGRINAPQAFVSSYAPRIRTYGNSLLAPVQPQNVLPPVRTTKRGTQVLNYAEDFDDDSIDDSDGPRRPTGLRTQPRREPDPNAERANHKELGKEAHAPVDVQGIWREWMGKPKRALTERQLHVQSALPTTLVPIRIDLDVAPFRPEAALPTPNNAKEFGIDENLPAYKAPEPTPQYRLKDSFLWNLHEALITPDQFAKTFVDELDFPVIRKQAMIAEIANSIRQQLEEHAATALHPLFQPPTAKVVPPTTGAPTPSIQQPTSRADSSTPMPADTPDASFLQPPHLNGNGDSGASTPMGNGTSTPALAVTAQPIPREPSSPSVLNPPDSHRCILTLSVNLQNQLFTDKFEWSLMHPPGFPEIFAKQTCADLGLGGEWVPNLAHAIYEASLRLKKDMVDNNGSLVGVVGSGVIGYGDLQNEACEYHGTGEIAVGEFAGWRYDEDGLGSAWEPKIEVLSKEEIEKREGDRERQLRRARRETARFSTTFTTQPSYNDYFSSGVGQANGGGEDERMGRGERSKKKRRFRSLSPVGRETPEVAGFGGTSSQLSDGERQYWRCSHCKVWGAAIWGVRDGPAGPRVITSPSCASHPNANSLTFVSRRSATTAASSTSATRSSHPGTTTSSTASTTKPPAKRTCLPTPNQRPLNLASSPTCNRTWPPSPSTPLPRPLTAPCSNPTATSTRPPTSIQVPPGVRARSARAPWRISSTMPSRARTWTGPRSRNRAKGSGCRILLMDGSIASVVWRLRAIRGVEGIIRVRRGWGVI